MLLKCPILKKEMLKGEGNFRTNSWIFTLLRVGCPCYEESVSCYITACSVYMDSLELHNKTAAQSLLELSRFLNVQTYIVQ